MLLDVMLLVSYLLMQQHVCRVFTLHYHLFVVIWTAAINELNCWWVLQVKQVLSCKHASISTVLNTNRKNTRTW